MITFIQPSNIKPDYVLSKENNLLEMKEVAALVHADTKNKIHISVDKANENSHNSFLNLLAKHTYNFNKYKTNSNNTAKRIVIVTKNDKNKYQDILDKIYHANIARNLANEPGNIVYPQSFCDRVKQMFKNVSNVQINVINEKEILKLNMNLLYAVGKGSVHAPRMLIIKLSAKNVETAKNVVLVGKGITFDTGGYSLKSQKAMEGMHGDKTGGSIVVAVLKYLATKQNSNNNYYGIIPLAENVVSGNSYKIGDVFKSYNRKTVEIGDTDKEGRLVLADALAYACDKFKPDLIIDVATLTSWASKLHCDICFNYFTLNEGLANRVCKLQNKTGERSIRLPPWIEYRKFTKSKIADFTTFDSRECGGNDGFMAAMFLSNFVEDKYLKNWIHIDIANDTTNQYMNANSFHTILDMLDLE
jgi:leucyl aminopeptidase